MTDDEKSKKRPSDKPSKSTYETIEVQENRFIDAGADSLIWPDKPVQLTEKEKLIRDAFGESIKTGKNIFQALRERGIYDYE